MGIVLKADTYDAGANWNGSQVAAAHETGIDTVRRTRRMLRKGWTPRIPGGTRPPRLAASRQCVERTGPIVGNANGKSIIRKHAGTRCTGLRSGVDSQLPSYSRSLCHIHSQPPAMRSIR
jgi:hypothetical protein